MMVGMFPALPNEPAMRPAAFSAAAGETHSASVNAPGRLSSWLGATVTTPLGPSNASAPRRKLPPAGSQVAPPVMLPLRWLGPASNAVVPARALNAYAATRPLRDTPTICVPQVPVAFV